MSITKYLKLDLGIPNLWPEWKSLFTKKYLLEDLNAGVTVACVAIPLSLAIALASGVSPSVGLVTAIIGGIVCALFGGTTLSVSGPAAAMSILIANAVERFGVKGLVFICLMIGLMQLVSGILRFGRLARFVPLPVIAAFTSGIGVIIIIGQLPRVFGLEPPAHSYIFSVLSHLVQSFSSIKPTALFIVIGTIAVIRLLPKVFPKIPAAIVAVIAATAAVNIFSLGNVPVIGEIPRTLPMPHLPMFNTAAMSELILTTFTIYMLACLETLLSTSAIDKLVKTDKHDPDQELIGQGLGNIVSSLFGGIPLTGVIARSAVNVQSGAKTRRASIIHSVVLLLTVFFAAPYIGMIPIAALAGVLLSVAFNMINYQEFRNLLKTSRSEAAIYAITFLMIIFVDLTAGVQLGILAACLFVLIRASRASLISHHSDDGMRLTLTGPLTFLSLNKVTDLEKNLQDISPNTPIILDLSNVSDLDSSGASALIDFVTNFRDRGFNVYLKGLSRKFETIFSFCEGGEILEEIYLTSETELKDKSKAVNSFHGRLLHGVQKFHADREDNDKRLFEKIAKSQDPHTLFITCSDSRIVTSMITRADPGELFIVRNVGNYIPPYNNGELHSEIAALEFALSQLDIREIVICGHSSCGAIAACCDPSIKLAPQLDGWVKKIRSQLKFDGVAQTVNDLSKQNVMNQIQNLKQYPIVQERLEKGSLNIHGWFIDLQQHLILEWNNEEQQFKPIGEDNTASLSKSLSNVDSPITEMFN